MADDSPSTSSTTLAAAVSHAKIPGTLHLTSSSLRWSPTQSSLAAQALSLPLHHIDRLFASVAKPESKTFSLKITFYQPEDPEEERTVVNGKPDVLFTFTAPDGRERALADQQAFKARLAQAANANKTERESIAAAPALKAGPKTPSTADSPAPTTAAPAASKAPELTEEEKARRREQELQLRISILQAHPDLKALHADLVITGLMRDAEFWSHPSRASLLRAERALLQQRQGRNARIADPKPINDGEGNVKINMSAQLVRDVFEQYPVVAKAYNDLVPGQMNEANFWTRYFHSKLYHRLRTSARSAASEHIVRADPIFDQYLDDLVEDDELESRREFQAHDSFLDLGATEEDHAETGNAKDWTMRAGAEKGALPLLRRFNEHSGSLLDSALGSQSSSGARRVVGGVGEEYDLTIDAAHQRTRDHYGQIVIDELEEAQKKRSMPLQVSQEQQSFFQGKDRAAEEEGPSREVSYAIWLISRGNTLTARSQAIESMVRSVHGELLDWSDSINQVMVGYTPCHKDNARVMKMILDKVRQQEEVRNDDASRIDLSENVQRQLVSCQAATTEFLRQFWAAVAPLPPAPAPPPGTIKGEAEEGMLDRSKPLRPAQRKTRAIKMLNLLKNAGERGESVAKLAEQEAPGRGAKRIKLALEPTERAVERALRIGTTMYPSAF